MSSQQPNPAIAYIRFGDWCLNFYSLSKKAQHTVEMLLKKAKTSDCYEVEQICYEAEQILSNLTCLSLGNNQISDLKPLQSLTNLTDLALERNRISDLTPLQSLTNLTGLNLYTNQISDLTPLQSLTNLTGLNLYNNQISDLTPLQSLTDLTDLALARNRISDLTPLQSLTDLTDLDLRENQISDLTPLQSLTHLTKLSPSRNQISDLTPLQSLTDLTFLKLNNNRISDLTPLQSLRNLTKLYLYKNQISDLTPLQSLRNLTRLDLSKNQISDLTPLQSLRNLTFLNLYKNQISDLTPLQSLRNLTELYLRNNQISDLTPLQSLTDLTSLDLTDNQISDLTPLQSLRNLTYLDLRKNRISDLTPLQSMTNLTHLYLNENQISDLTPLQSLTNLTHLYLNKNQISDFTPLQSLTNLKHLDLSKNQILDLKSLQSLWKTRANSTERVDRARAAAAIEFAYTAIGKTCPKIIFCSSPDSAVTQLKELKSRGYTIDLLQLVDRQLTSACRPFESITYNSSYSFYRSFSLRTYKNLYSPEVIWEGQLIRSLGRNLFCFVGLISLVTESLMLDRICMADFCASVIRIVLNPDAQKVFESLKQLLFECGWIFTFEDVCCACDRPSKLSLDTEERLHAEGESAIEFTDGYKIYSYHGVTLPEKYGQIHPNQWEARWILEEKNAELRRVLIQGIGYARICCELQVEELDSWQEYTLLKIDNTEVELIYLLKMTYSSTGFIHAWQIPPHVRSAREAILWETWDIDPTEFSVQT